MALLRAPRTAHAPPLNVQRQNPVLCWQRKSHVRKPDQESRGVLGTEMETRDLVR